MSRRKSVEPIPEEFTSYEEAAEFWEKHDTTDYPNAFRTVEATTRFKRRYYEIEIDADVLQALRPRARQKGVTVSRLASDLLRQQIASSG